MNIVWLIGFEYFVLLLVWIVCDWFEMKVVHFTNHKAFQCMHYECAWIKSCYTKGVWIACIGEGPCKAVGIARAWSWSCRLGSTEVEWPRRVVCLLWMVPRIESRWGRSSRGTLFWVSHDHHMSKPKPTPRRGLKFRIWKYENPLVVPLQSHGHGFWMEMILVIPKKYILQIFVILCAYYETYMIWKNGFRALNVPLFAHTNLAPHWVPCVLILLLLNFCRV